MRDVAFASRAIGKFVRQRSVEKRRMQPAERDHEIDEVGNPLLGECPPVEPRPRERRYRELAIERFKEAIAHRNQQFFIRIEIDIESTFGGACFSHHVLDPAVEPLHRKTRSAASSNSARRTSGSRRRRTFVLFKRRVP
jgi:hypothetical protein